MNLLQQNREFVIEHSYLINICKKLTDNFVFIGRMSIFGSMHIVLVGSTKCIEYYLHCKGHMGKRSKYSGH